VQISNTTIQGGTLNTSSGGVMETAGTIGLDAVTSGAITLSNGTTLTAGSGTINKITGTLNLGTTAVATLALTGQLQLTGNTTFSGPGAVVMTSTSGNTGQIGTNGTAFTLTNNSTIAGSGLIGSDASAVFPNLSLTNNGTINANSNGATLGVGGNGALIVNTGLLEATNGGILALSTSNPLNNNGGNITATGAGSIVQISNTTIQGGTLNTSSGGVMETAGTIGLDASTHGAITISNGSTLTAGTGTINEITGTLNLGTTASATLALEGQMQLTGNTTFSGPGTVVMTSINGNTGQIGTNGTAFTLTNNSTITGSGLIGSNASSVFPNLSLNNTGTINANSSGNTLEIGGTGTLNNTGGTLEASNGGTLLVGLATASNFTNFSGSTLTGGTYIVNGASGNTATMEINTGGGQIATNAASIILNGPTANTIFENTGAAALLAPFATNAAAGNFTINGGYGFTTAGAFTNSGGVLIGATGAPSTFTMKAGNNYTQNSGVTEVDGSLVSATASINGGTIQGSGTITGNLSAAGGTVMPGSTGSLTSSVATPGTLTVTGNYGSSGQSFTELISGFGPGLNGLLQVNGNADIITSGALNAPILLSSFVPEVGETFTVLNATGGLTGQFGNQSAYNNGSMTFGTNEAWSLGYTADSAILQATSTVPITATWSGPSGNWTTNVAGATNWSCSIAVFGGCVPNNGTVANYNAVLDSAKGNVMTLASTDSPNSITVNTLTMTSGTLNIGSGATLNLAAQASGITDINANSGLTLGGTFEIGGVATTSGISQLASVEGNLTLQNGQTTNVTPGGGTLVNSGSVTLGSTGNTLAVTGNFNNAGGTLTYNGSGDLLQTSGTFTNSGTVSENGTSDNLKTTGLFTNTGTVGVGAGETLTANGGYTQTGGATSGAGTIIGAVSVTGGSIMGGTAGTPGTLNITGTLGLGTGTGTATLSEVIGSNTVASAINATGVITLGSNAMLSISGFTPTGLVDYTILTGSSVGGSQFANTAAIDSTTFDGGTEEWNLVYNGTNIQLDAVAVVAPPSQFTATWQSPAGNGNWTASAQWTCNPTLTPCVPNNGTPSGDTYAAVLNDTGKTLTLNTSETINQLTMTAGVLDIASGGTLNLVNQPGGITDINANSGLTLGGTFEIGGVATASGIGQLATVEGNLTLANGQTTSVTPGGTLTVSSTGSAYVQQTSTLSVTGNVSNSGSVILGNGASDTGTNKLGVSGTFGNSGTVSMVGSNDVLTSTGLFTNTGTVGIGASETLNANGGYTQTAGTTTVTGNLNTTIYTNTGGTTTVQNGGTVTASASTSNAGLISLTGTGSTFKAGALTNTGTITLSGTNDSLTADLTNSGAMNLNGAGDTMVDGGVFTNNSTGSLNFNAANTSLAASTVSGNFANNSGASVTFGAGSTKSELTVSGTFTNGSTVSMGGANDVLTSTGLFTNTGTVGIGAAEALDANGGYTQTAGTTTISLAGVLGTSTNNYTQSGGTTTVNGSLNAATVNISNTGALQGTGKITGNVVMTGGTITPGSLSSTPGTLTITGNLDMSGGGTFDELISNTANGILDVSGAITLGGTSQLDVTLLGFDPSIGTTYEIFDPSSLGGEFSNTAAIDAMTFNGGTEQWDLVYNPGNDPNGVELEAVQATVSTTTPEPSGLVMLGAGLLALAILSRKRLGSIAAR
jgi:hypothetical protein